MKRILSGLGANKPFLVLLLLFVIASGAWLHRVPGLMGDEASEGENVYELLTAETITITGERSYIGPLPDYVRVPFVGVFSYTALALRLPIWLASIATFAFAWRLFRKQLGADYASAITAVVFFSPIYLTYQRLGWAITLFPFFALLIITLLFSEWRHRFLLAGLVAGAALHTHIMFFPTLLAIAAVWVIVSLLRSGSVRERAMRIVQAWPGIVGFWAAFATQFVILLQFTEDQGDPGAVAELFSDRLAALPSILPLVISGSSFVARYTGTELAPLLIWTVIAVTSLVGVHAFIDKRTRVQALLWGIGLDIHLLALLYMIDRFTLRYFVVLSLGWWLIVGFGAAGLVQRLPQRWRAWAPVVIATLLLVWFFGSVLVPFLGTGGSVADFSLGNRTNSAAALVDTRPLAECVRGQGTVTSEGVHIFNRLQYMSHHDAAIHVVPEDQAKSADLLVHYRWSKGRQVPAEHELCPELAHFVVERR